MASDLYRYPVAVSQLGGAQVAALKAEVATRAAAEEQLRKARAEGAEHQAAAAAALAEQRARAGAAKEALRSAAAALAEREAAAAAAEEGLHRALKQTGERLAASEAALTAQETKAAAAAAAQACQASPLAALTLHLPAPPRQAAALSGPLTLARS